MEEEPLILDIKVMGWALQQEVLGYGTLLLQANLLQMNVCTNIYIFIVYLVGNDGKPDHSTHRGTIK